MFNHKMKSSVLKGSQQSSFQSGRSLMPDHTPLMPDSPLRSFGIGKRSSTSRSLNTPRVSPEGAIIIKKSPFFIRETVGTQVLENDYYRFKLDKGTKANAFLYNNSGIFGTGSKIKIELQDKRGRVLDSKVTRPRGAKASAQISSPLRAGKYYIRVSSKGNIAEYELAFSNE